MNSLTIFDIPLALANILPIAAAIIMGWAGYVVGKRFTPNIRRTGAGRLDSFVGARATRGAVKSAPVGSLEYRVRIAASRFKIDVAGREEYYLMAARAAAGVALTFVLMIIGLPFITSLIGLIAGFVFVNGFVARAWNKVRIETEAELPSLLLRLNSTVQTSPNVPAAMEIVAKTLNADGPLRQWTLDTAARMHAEGHGVMEDVRQGAAAISTSLAIATELIGRVWTTGGEGYAKAFGAAADNLESVLDARVLARSKGSGAQGTVNILTVMTFGMMAFMTRNPAMADTIGNPLVQVLYALVALVIVYGHGQVSELIDSAV